MKKFVTSDTHFSHLGILHHCPERGRRWKTVEEMNEALIENWNSVVKREDEVHIIGDYAWRDHNKFTSILNGRKILYIGSHDRMPQNCLRNFTEVKDRGMAKIAGYDCFFQHEAGRTFPRAHYGVCHLFGHSHGRMQTLNLSFDCGVDTELANYFPLSEEQIEAEIVRRLVMMCDAGRIEKVGGKIMYRQDDVYWILKLKERYEENIDPGRGEDADGGDTG